MEFDAITVMRIVGTINLIIFVTIPFWIFRKRFRTIFKILFGGGLLLLLAIFGLGKLAGRGRGRGLW